MGQQPIQRFTFKFPCIRLAELMKKSLNQEERRIAVKRLNHKKERFHNWIADTVLCLWQGLEAVSGEILFV